VQARALARVASVAAFLACIHCSGPVSPSPGGPPGTNPPPPSSGPQVFVGAGDIGWCGSPGPEQTARIIDTIDGTVFTAGDNAYPSGTRQQYHDCYDPSWGRHKARTRPVPGNHEYESANADPYFEYFGAAAGPPGLGYYSFEVGDWHAVALNSNVATHDGSAQAQWLRADLAASRSRCTIAYWHHPLFSSGPNGNAAHMRDLWRILYDAGADVIVTGHDHLYERFAPQDADGRSDAARGMREFVVGTGGAELYTVVTPRPNSEVRIANAYGVLKLTLQNAGYQWEFLPVSGGGDSGSGSCH
jgi:hypothetical protein